MPGTNSYATAATTTSSAPANDGKKQQRQPNLQAHTNEAQPPRPLPNPYHTPRTSSPESSVYVLTLSTTPSIHEPLTSLRSAHFPPHLNKTPAHITLFHALPHSRFAVFDATIASLARNKRSYAISTGQPRRMRKGVLILLDKGNKETQALRAELLAEFLREEDEEEITHIPISEPQSLPSRAPQSEDPNSPQTHQQDHGHEERKGWLSAQDRKSAGWSVHWTVMNKVDDDKKVQAALSTLTRQLCDQPERGRVDGLLLWRYLPGGTWEGVKEYRFANDGGAGGDVDGVVEGEGKAAEQREGKEDAWRRGLIKSVWRSITGRRGREDGERQS